MGKRQPHACPVQGCAKTGNLSGIKQHFREKHRRDIDDATLSAIIMKMEKITMPVYIKKDDAPNLPFRQKLGWFLFGAVFGSALLAVAHISLCYMGGNACPAAIERLIHAS